MAHQQMRDMPSTTLLGLVGQELQSVILHTGLQMWRIRCGLLTESGKNEKTGNLSGESCLWYPRPNTLRHSSLFWFKENGIIQYNPSTQRRANLKVWKGFSMYNDLTVNYLQMIGDTAAFSKEPDPPTLWTVFSLTHNQNFSCYIMHLLSLALLLSSLRKAFLISIAIIWRMKTVTSSPPLSSL